MAESSPAAPPRDDPVWRLRWLLLASCVCVAFAVTVMIVILPIRWHWSPLWWGVAMTVATLAVRQAVMTVLVRRVLAVLPHLDEASARREQLRRRERIYIPLWVFMGIIVSVIAAAFDLIWVVIAVGAFMLLSLAAGVAAAAVVLRRSRTA